MTKKQKKQSSVIVKVYIFILFVCGIILGLSFISTDKNNQNFIEQKLDNDLVTILVANDIEQGDVIAQYIKESKNGNQIYNQYYKNIYLPNNKKIANIELQLKILARNFKINISKNVEPDKSYKYIFYDKNKTYSTVVFTRIKG
ncbi:MAG: hypothetical protein PHR82_03540 [Endomicrobiaceae bacterium]|nr:hypothetical protein [Endomicrobiaceae bacterium]